MLFRFCIPSILKTLESGYDYVAYIGIDEGDRLAQPQFLEVFDKFKQVNFEAKPHIIPK